MKGGYGGNDVEWEIYPRQRVFLCLEAGAIILG